MLEPVGNGWLPLGAKDLSVKMGKTLQFHMVKKLVLNTKCRFFSLMEDTDQSLVLCFYLCCSQCKPYCRFMVKYIGLQG